MKPREKLILCLLFGVLATVAMGSISFNTSTTVGIYQSDHSVVVASDKLVSAVTAVYSDVFPLGGRKSLGLWGRATSVAGTPVVSYTIEFAPTKTAADFSELEGGSGTLAINDENPHNDILVNKYSNYARIRINGVGANPVDTLVDMVINFDR